MTLSKFDDNEISKIVDEMLNDHFDKSPRSFEDYLIAVKSRMCKIEYPDVPATGNKRLDVHLQEMANLEPSKLNEPNDNWKWMWENREILSKFIHLDRNKLLTPLAIKTLAKTYLVREGIDGIVLENPQYMFIRVAAMLRRPDVEAVHKVYDDMSTFQYIHASPTLFNAGMTRPQMSSCFLIKLDDNMQSIAWTMYCIAAISKTNGATGISLGSLRTHSNIANSGMSKGTSPVARIYNDITAYVDQGGKRNGATQLCQFIWHEDIQEHINLTRKFGDEMKHIQNTDTSVATYDLFWRRVDEDGPWALFCPTQVPGLDRLYGSNFEEAYLKAESSHVARKVVRARRLAEQIAEVLIESGRPYVINIDSINTKTNMSNIGFISTLNLCQEIALPADRLRIPSCNLSSVCLKSKVVNGKFDFDLLAESVREQVYNLNNVIERNYYSLPEIEFANLESLPIGIGAQGFIDAILKLDLLFDSTEARELNHKIAACMYYNALRASCELAKVKGPYPRFQGSPFSKGILQFDQWNFKPLEPFTWGQSGSWEELKADIMKYGVRNSQLTTAQPTASVSTISDNGETWEPYYSNLFTRLTMNGSFTKFNIYLRDDLRSLNLWDDKLITWLYQCDGSVQGLTKFIDTDVDDVKARLEFLEKKHRTVFEYSQKVILEMAAIRGPYIDGSQSTNIYMKKPNVFKVTECLAYSNRLGLKTLIYYLRSLEAQKTIKAIGPPVKPNVEVEKDEEDASENTCSINNPGCLSCQ